MDTGVAATVGRLRGLTQRLAAEAVGCVWQALLVVTGLGVAVTTVVDRFITDVAATLDARCSAWTGAGANATRLDGQITLTLWLHAARAVRRAEPLVHAWRARAARLDRRLLERRTPYRPT